MTTCQECHICEAAYVTDTGRNLCATCYFGDNIGTACDPGECDIESCCNFKGVSMSNENTASSVNLEDLKKLLSNYDITKEPDMSRAYLVLPPPMFDQLGGMTIEPFTTSEADEKAFRYSVFKDSLYKVPVIKSPILTMIDIGGFDSPPEKIVWKEIPQISVVPVWQWLVVITFGIFILLTLSYVFH